MNIPRKRMNKENEMIKKVEKNFTQNEDKKEQDNQSQCDKSQVSESVKSNQEQNENFQNVI